MAIIQFQNVQRVFHQNGKDFVALKDINLEVQGPRVRRHRRPLGLRQDDLHAHGCRAGASRRAGRSASMAKWSPSPAPTARWCSRPSRCSRGRRSGTTSSSACSRCGVDAPERKRRIEQYHRADGPRRLRARLPAPALGRHAAARGHRARLCARSRGAADGRALRRARCADARASCRKSWCGSRAQQPAHGAVHHPRGRGGGVPGRPHRRHDAPARAVREIIDVDDRPPSAKTGTSTSASRT